MGRFVSPDCPSDARVHNFDQLFNFYPRFRPPSLSSPPPLPPNFSSFLLSLMRIVLPVFVYLRPKDPITYSRNDFELMEVSLLREMLRLQFQAQANDPKVSNYMPRCLIFVWSICF